MDRVQEVLALDDFLLFLSSRNIYTNGPIYFKYLSLWITKASSSPSHHKQDYLRRALRLFDQYFQKFSSLPPSKLPSFRFSIPPLFPKRDVYIGWPYMETKRQQQKRLQQRIMIWIWTHFYTVSPAFLLWIKINILFLI
jgi:hypothetical protein